MGRELIAALPIAGYWLDRRRRHKNKPEEVFNPKNFDEEEFGLGSLLSKAARVLPNSKRKRLLKAKRKALNEDWVEPPFGFARFPIKDTRSAAALRLLSAKIRKKRSRNSPTGKYVYRSPRKSSSPWGLSREEIADNQVAIKKLLLKNSKTNKIPQHWTIKPDLTKSLMQPGIKRLGIDAYGPRPKKFSDNPLVVGRSNSGDTRGSAPLFSESRSTKEKKARPVVHRFGLRKKGIVGAGLGVAGLATGSKLSSASRKEKQERQVRQYPYYR